jgi:hypothetical protein
MGSTGFEPADLRIAEAARKVAIVLTGKFSLGVSMLMGLLASVARGRPRPGTSRSSSLITAGRSMHHPARR